MNLKRKSIAIDMDGVIADTVAQFITWYYKETNLWVTKDDFIGKPETEVLPNGELRRLVYNKGFFHLARNGRGQGSGFALDEKF